MQIGGSKRRLFIIATIVIAVLVTTVVSGLLWYQVQLSPRDSSYKGKVRVSIEKGMTAGDVGRLLERNQVIRSALALSLYMRTSGMSSEFRAGVYSISPASSAPEIVRYLIESRADEMSVTFFPGATLRGLSSKKESERTDVSIALARVGFKESEIERALKADYSSPIFAGRPVGAGLEGYVYGETYFVDASATPEDVIRRSLEEFSKVVKKHDLEAKFAQRGLSLFEGITLASIVQRESIGCKGQSVCEDQRLIAGVFFNRLAIDMPLGSDVTYHFAADMKGVDRDHRLNSPYNTRIHKGLPPGPIAVPGLSALNAVADPLSTDYMYFLSGDDDITYFGVTNAEHEANIRNHCQKKCLLP